MWLQLTIHRAMRVRGSVEVYSHIFLTSGWIFNFIIRHLYSEKKSPLWPFVRRLFGPLRRCGRPQRLFEQRLVNFLFNNQPDAVIIQTYSVIKLYKFRASSLPIIRDFYCTFGIGNFHAGLMNMQVWWPFPSRVRMELEFHPDLQETYQCRMYGRKLLMMGREDVRNL